MNISKSLLLFFAALLFSCSTNQQANESSKDVAAESERFNEFMDRIFDEAVDRDPRYQTVLGIKKDYDKWTDLSDENAQKELEILKKNLEQMKKDFDPDNLDEQAKISYSLFEYDANERINGFKYRFHNYPLNQMDGIHTDIPAFLINMHQVSDIKDAEAYVARLQKVPAMFDQVLAGMKTREEKKIIPPKFVFPMVRSDIEQFLKGQPFDTSKETHSLLEDFSKKVNVLQINEKSKEALINDAKEALVTNVKPAYEKLLAAWNELEKKATDDDGAWKFPEGEDYYKFALKRVTTTGMSPDEIHELGLKEVARIHNEMRAIMKQVNFKNDNLQEFFEFMRKDRRFYYPNTEEGKKQFLAKSVDLIETMKGKLDALFVTKPKAQIVVKAVEPFREKSAGNAFYEEPAADGSRPGRYYVNLYDTENNPIYQMEALAYHEGIPGHHMQIAIAQELQGIPKFRRFGGNTAYIEGWALYSEKLGKEVGLYQDPYSDFGRLAMELFRAARLVVDTGIHYKKWKRDQALAYFNENTPNPPGDNQKEIDRYIVWPGQATGYKIGMNKIIELREKASKELADKFDIREFHDVILTSGSLPLSVVEEQVNNYISTKKNSTKKA